MNFTEKTRAGHEDSSAGKRAQAGAKGPVSAPALHMRGVNAFRRGDVDVGIALVRRAIAADGSAAAFHANLGLMLVANGELAAAVGAYRRALELRLSAAPGPRLDEARSDLALVLCEYGSARKRAGSDSDARAAFEEALQLRPGFAEAWNNLGSVFLDNNQLDDALEAFRKAVELREDFADALYNLAITQRKCNAIEAAISSSRRAIAARPEWSLAWNNLGTYLHECGSYREALTAFEHALSLAPDFAEALCNLGGTLRELDRTAEAIAACQRAIALRPNYAEAHNNLGDAYRRAGRLDEAIASLQTAIGLRENLAEAHNNLGNAYKDAGQLPEAIASYTRAIELRPDDAVAASNRLYALLFHDVDAAELAREHQRFAERHAAPLARHAHATAREKDRRLRIGYVSPNFREHVVGLNILPLFVERDRERFEVYCYSDVAREDDITAQFAAHADHWRRIRGQTDEQVAATIHADGIDILVDLTLHMSNNRMLVFARKPAPVQITFAGYPGTTGLDAIDYRLTDPYLDPPDHDARYAEKSLRLADSFWCYANMGDEVPVAPLPSLKSGAITFGCLNNFCKITPDVFALWARVLRELPDSRLLILAGTGKHVARTTDLLGAAGIARERVEFVGFQSREQYLRTYARIDIGLDSFPYNGHTTSLDSLWMGVPVVTLVGEKVVQRAGWSQLSNLGLQELAARTPDDFLRRAVGLAQDRVRLANLRATLRERMRRSPLMDAKKFTRAVEQAFVQSCAGEASRR